MRKRRKMSIMIFMIMMVGIFTLSTRVEAALQANGGTPVTANLNDWVSGVRQMQATGGTLGLTDTINTNLTSSNKNMDIHMQKNTEYGAMAILSASAYGNPNKITDGQTTTGNASGVVMKFNKEWVAAGVSVTRAENMSGAVKRYWNVYTANENSTKKGDAMTETAGWHGSGASQWLYHRCNGNCDQQPRSAGLIRAYSGSVFSYYGCDMNYIGGSSCNKDLAPTPDKIQWFQTQATYGGLSVGFYGYTYASRAAIVVGSGV